MSSEYEPAFGKGRGGDSADLQAVSEAFREASRPYLQTPWSWAAWGVLLPAAALLTPALERRAGALGVLLLWSGAVLLGGAVELAFVRAGPHRERTALATWVLRTQGNLSLVATLLSGVLVWQGLAWTLPGLWLLLLGHSLLTLGGLAFPPFRRVGLLYQIAGLLALWPHGASLLLLAAATAAGNLGLAVAVWRARRS